MKATEFEYRHQTLLHQCIIGAAFLTYSIDREDVVWHFVKDHAAPHNLERIVFIIAALLIGIGTMQITKSRAEQKPWPAKTPKHGQLRRFLGELCFAAGLASLAPIPGALILVGGEVLRVLRLFLRDKSNAEDSGRVSEPKLSQSGLPEEFAAHSRWGIAVRKEAGKWGILITMIVFAITLVDRYAEVLAAASLFLAILLNVLPFGDSPLKRGTS
jgi:hypothetical protein